MACGRGSNLRVHDLCAGGCVVQRRGIPRLRTALQPAAHCVDERGRESSHDSYQTTRRLPLSVYWQRRVCQGICRRCGARSVRLCPLCAGCLIVGIGTTRFIRSGSFADSCATAAHADDSIVVGPCDFILLAYLVLLLPEWRHLEQGCRWCLLALLALLALLLAPRGLILAPLVRSVGLVGDHVVHAAALGG